MRNDKIDLGAPTNWQLLTIFILLVQIMPSFCFNPKNKRLPHFYEDDFLTSCEQSADPDGARAFQYHDPGEETDPSKPVYTLPRTQRVRALCILLNTGRDLSKGMSFAGYDTENSGYGANIRSTCKHLSIPKSSKASKLSEIYRRKFVSIDCGTRVGIYLAKCADLPEETHLSTDLMPCQSNCATVTAIKACKCHPVDSSELVDCYQRVLAELRSRRFADTLENEAHTILAQLVVCPFWPLQELAAECKI